MIQFMLIYFLLDPEDILRQPVSDSAVEAEHVGALSRHERVASETRCGRRTQHVPRL